MSFRNCRRLFIYSLFCSVHNDLVLMESRFHSYCTEWQWKAQTEIASSITIYKKKKKKLVVFLSNSFA